MSIWGLHGTAKLSGREDDLMGKAITGFVLSMVAGIGASFINGNLGIIISISIIGSIIIYQNDKKDNN